MNILSDLRWRYATKKFDETKELSSDKIDRLIEAFNLTATSYGLQPLQLGVIQNKALQKELIAHSFNQQQVGQAAALLVICIEKNIDEQYISNYFKRVHEVRQTPDEVLASFRSFLIDSFGKKSQEDIEKWASKQAYIALGTLLTVCAVEKIDSCPMEGFQSDKYDEVLNLREKGLKSVLVLPIGYRAADDMFSSLEKVRKESSQVSFKIA